jgi:hypothetical protein
MLSVTVSINTRIRIRHSTYPVTRVYDEIRQTNVFYYMCSILTRSIFGVFGQLPGVLYPPPVTYVNTCGVGKYVYFFRGLVLNTDFGVL